MHSFGQGVKRSKKCLEKYRLSLSHNGVRWNPDTFGASSGICNGNFVLRSHAFYEVFRVLETVLARFKFLSGVWDGKRTQVVFDEIILLKFAVYFPNLTNNFQRPRHLNWQISYLVQICVKMVHLCYCHYLKQPTRINLLIPIDNSFGTERVALVGRILFVFL